MEKENNQPSGKFLRWIQSRTRRVLRKPRIGLALGSGGAWGVAHIGVLSALQELKVPISYLSGSSSGSIVGAMYAAGVEGKAMESFGREYSWRDAASLTYFPKMGLATNNRLVSYLKDRIGNPDFEDLELPFYVPVTHLTSGRLRMIHQGPVLPAVQASCAIPGVFSPVEIDSELYCDGGLLNKIPCKILKEAGADLVIAVELSSSNPKPPANIFEVINRALDIALIGQTRLDLQSADLIIRPDVNGLSEFVLDQNEVLIERGKQAAHKQLGPWLPFHTTTTQP